MAVKLVGGVFLVLCLIAVGVFFWTPTTVGQRANSEEATVVYRGQVTAPERTYSAEYKKLNPLWRGSTFSEHIAESEARGDGIGELGGVLGGYEGFFLPNQPAVKPNAFLAKLACTSDAIVVGSVRSKASHMTEDERFIYTAYGLSVQEILKNNISAPIIADSEIEVTRPGGLVKLNGRSIRIVERSYIPLQTEGIYLLFLRFVPTAKGYMPASPEGDFVLDNGTYKQLTIRRLPKELAGNNDPKELLKAVRISTTASCSKETTGGAQ